MTVKRGGMLEEPTREQRAELDRLCEEHGTLLLDMTRTASDGVLLHVEGADRQRFALREDGSRV